MEKDDESFKKGALTSHHLYPTLKVAKMHCGYVFCTVGQLGDFKTSFGSLFSALFGIYICLSIE